jgi:hypothetical protein
MEEPKSNNPSTNSNTNNPNPANNTSPLQSMGSAVGEIKNKLNTEVQKFRNNKLVSGTWDFLNSNSLVAKFAFLILIVLIFIGLLRLGQHLANFLFGPKPNPYLTRGITSGRKAKIIEQDIRSMNSIPILRSKNQREGLTYTYSVWLMIEKIENNKRQHIFHKGSSFTSPGVPDKFNTDGMDNPNGGSINFMQDGNQTLPFPNISPGVFVKEGSNTLVIFQNTYNNILENVEVDNIPMNKWFHLAIRVENKNMDVFINGKIASSYILTSPPKQNYGNLYLSHGDGFNGKMSSLRYFSKSLSGTQINDINLQGPDLFEDKKDLSLPPYLSLNWYLN